MTAQEMFEAIGYHQVVISPKYCSYSFDDGGYIKSIEFIGIKKEIRLHDLETYNDNKSQDVFVLDEYELKAINKQMEELGWLDSERKAIYHLTKFEYDLLNEDKEIHEWYFKCFDHLMRLKEQGHFKDVNIEKQIGEILLNCEVVG